MSIDFSTLKGLTIPEGVVTQITDASGNVLWKKISGIPITVSGFGGYGIMSDSNALVIIDGTKHSGIYTGEAQTYYVPAGTVITCQVCSPTTTAPATILLNGTTVLTVTGLAVPKYGTYEYTVNKPVSIHLEQVTFDTRNAGKITITD